MNRSPAEALTLPPGLNPFESSFHTLRRAPDLLKCPKPANILPSPSSPPPRILPLAPAPATSPHHIRSNPTRASTENPVAINQPTPLTTPLLRSKAIEKPSKYFRVSNIRPLMPAPSNERATAVSNTPLPPVASHKQLQQGPPNC